MSTTACSTLNTYLTNPGDYTVLNLANQNISDDDAVEIGKAIKSTEKVILEALYLDNNKIGNNGFIEIINSLFDFSRVPFFGDKAFRGETLRILSFHENNITFLPAELTDFSEYLKSFSYYGNPIDYIPSNVQRWLLRTFPDGDTDNDRDKQGEENTHIFPKNLLLRGKETLFRIINAGPPKYQSFEELREVIVNDSILSDKCKQVLLTLVERYEGDDGHSYYAYGLTFKELLLYVFTRIEMNEESGDEMKKMLSSDFTDEILCNTYHIHMSRLFDCFFLDPLYVHIIVNFNLNEMFRNVGIRLIKEDKYSTEAHQIQFEKELQEDYGYEVTEEVRKEFEERFYCDLEIFYDVFEPQVKSSNTNQGESLGK